MLQARLVLLRFLLRDIVIKKTIGVCRRRKMKNQAKQKRSKKQSLSIYELRNKENKKLASVKQMTTELTQKKKKPETRRHTKTKDAEANRVTL